MAKYLIQASYTAEGAKGLLKDSATRISEITDGTSNSIAILECAGRDER